MDLYSDYIFEQYEIYKKTEENLTGVMSIQCMGKNNQLLKGKIRVWDNNVDYRAKLEKRIINREKTVNEALKKWSDDFTLDNEMIVHCQREFQ